MKKTLIKIAVFVAVGLGAYFTYEHYFGCKGTCDESCTNKDSVSVSVTPTISVNDSCAVKDTTKK